MRRVHHSRIPAATGVPAGPLVGALGVAALLAGIAWTSGLDPLGWTTGLACGAGGSLLLARGLGRAGRTRLGPADRVTLSRLVLTCGVAALVTTAWADPVLGAGARGGMVLVLLAAVALALDGVDGRVARRTGTVTALGARFDMETDAFLILVLSLYVAAGSGWWVLAIGLARYVFVAVGWLWPWLRGSAPPRRWCKVVAALQGIVLTVVAAGLLPATVATVALVVSLGLLAESFGREAWQLWWLANSPVPGAPVLPGALAGGPMVTGALARASLASGPSDA